LLVVLVTVFIWYWEIAVKNSNETYPYKSKILDGIF
jgi:hypothetical protein